MRVTLKLTLTIGRREAPVYIEAPPVLDVPLPHIDMDPRPGIAADVDSAPVPPVEVGEEWCSPYHAYL